MDSGTEKQTQPALEGAISPEEPAASTVEKASPITTPKVKYTDADKDLGFDNPLLEKVRQLLVSTNPETWSIGGEDLTSELRVERPRNSFEQILVRDIPNGSLALHCVQPVTSQYMPGGYALMANGPAAYTIEVRDRIFDADKAVNPKYAANQKGKRCDIVASGDIAKSLFLQVRETVRAYHKECKKTFDQAVRDLTEKLLSIIESSEFSSWTKSEGTNKEEQEVIYSTEREAVKIEVVKRTKDWDSTFRVVFSKDKFTNSSISNSTAKACFTKLEELEQNSQLVALADRLKALGL